MEIGILAAKLNVYCSALTVILNLHGSALLNLAVKPQNQKSLDWKHQYRAEVIDTLPSGEYLVEFELFNDSDPLELAQRIGSIPSPLCSTQICTRRWRYQTVYANNEKLSAVAAPTAGLHFTDKIF